MDRRDAARRVSALRAKAVAEGTTGPEKASLEAKAKELETKYKLKGSSQPPLSYPRVTSNPTWTGREEYADAIMKLFNDPMFKAPEGKTHPDAEDFIEGTYLFTYEEGDDDDPSY